MFWIILWGLVLVGSIVGVIWSKYFKIVHFYGLIVLVLLGALKAFKLALIFYVIVLIAKIFELIIHKKELPKSFKDL
jgi:hypothetical protein